MGHEPVDGIHLAPRDGFQAGFPMLIYMQFVPINATLKWVIWLMVDRGILL